jgi:hypothetical protein
MHIPLAPEVSTTTTLTMKDGSGGCEGPRKNVYDAVGAAGALGEVSDRDGRHELRVVALAARACVREDKGVHQRMWCL